MMIDVQHFILSMSHAPRGQQNSFNLGSGPISNQIFRVQRFHIFEIANDAAEHPIWAKYV